ADLDVFAKLFEDGLERRLEAQAISRGEIGGYDDVLDFFVGYGFTPPAQLIGSGGVKRRIAPARKGVASQFPRYGGFGSLKRPGDGADRAAGRSHDRDLVSFFIQEM